MVAVLTASPTRSEVRPHVGTTSSRRYERRRPARPITQADLATLTEKVRRRVVRRFRMQRLLDADAAPDMLRWENSGFSVDASVRITPIDRDVPSYFQSLEHLLRYCTRPPFALGRLSVRRGEDGHIACVRYVLPRHKATNWVGLGRERKSTRPGANGVVELTAVAPRDPPRSADACRSAIGRPIFFARDSRAAHQSGDACGSAIDRAILSAAKQRAGSGRWSPLPT
jgi:hypothetical protein